MKSQGASQFKQIESQKVQHEQVQISKSFNNMIQQESMKTVQTTKSDNREYRYDAKEKGNNSYSGSGKKKKNNQNDNKKETGKPSKTGSIDILI